MRRVRTDPGIITAVHECEQASREYEALVAADTTTPFHGTTDHKLRAMLHAYTSTRDFFSAPVSQISSYQFFELSSCLPVANIYAWRI